MSSKTYRETSQASQKMPAMPTADDIRDFRANSRRIEAIIQSLSLDSGQNGKRVWKEVSKLRKRAGKVRDMDVLTDYLSSVSRHREEAGYHVRLLEHLGAQRLKCAKKFGRTRKQCGPSELIQLARSQWCRKNGRAS